MIRNGWMGDTDCGGGLAEGIRGYWDAFWDRIKGMVSSKECVHEQSNGRRGLRRDLCFIEDVLNDLW